MFPQLIAGPIVRYEDSRKQLRDRKITILKAADGAVWFVKGLGKKVLLANNIGMLFDALAAVPAGERSVLSTWLMILAYAFQIYFDFSGYSDMAVGLGKMLGFEFVQNFRYPYLATSATEFWRRWHISLGTWFREYVYIPMGGNRGGTVKYIRNILVVWFLTGLWHGADWTFVIWGLFFGVILLLEKLVLSTWMRKWPAVLGHIYALLVINLSWVIFSAGDINRMWQNFLAGLGGLQNPFIDSTFLYYLGSNLLLIIVCIVCCTPLVSKGIAWLCKRWKKKGQWIGALLYCLILTACVAYLVTATYNPLLYFRF